MKTVEEKLIDEFMNVRWDITLENAKECIDIAEEFAIGFAEWVDFKYHQNKYGHNKYAKSKEDFIHGNTYTVKELLEIYKKEKELC